MNTEPHHGDWHNSTGAELQNSKRETLRTNKQYPDGLFVFAASQCNSSFHVSLVRVHMHNTQYMLTIPSELVLGADKRQNRKI